MASTTRKAFALLLSIVLAVGLCPIYAFAEPTTEQSSSALNQQSDTSEADGAESTEGNSLDNESENDNAETAGNADPEAKEEGQPTPENSDNASKDVESETADRGGSSSATPAAANGKKNEDYSSIDSLAAANSGVLADGTYVLSSKLNSPKVLGIASSSKSNSAKAEIRTCTMSAFQKWTVSHDSKGYVILTNVGSGKVLDVKASAAENGATVQQYQPNGSRAQKWIAQKAPDGTLIFTSALNELLVLDIKSGKSSDGTLVQLYRANDSKAQSWTCYSTNANVHAGEDLSLGDDWYTVTTGLSSSFCLDVASASTKDKANVQIYSSNNSFAQMWRFEYHNGFYLIINGASGKALDVASGSVIPGTNIQQFSPKSTNANQLFSAKKNNDGSITFANKASGLTLEVQGSEAQNKQNVQAGSSTQSPSQNWNLIKADASIATGTYSITSALSSSKALDVKAASTSSNATFQLYSNNSSFAQKWHITSSDNFDGAVTIESLNSGLRLTGENIGTVSQKKSSDSAAQAWKVSLHDGGLLSFVNVATGKALDAKGGKTSNGTIVQSYKPNGTKAQLWRLGKTSEFIAGTYIIRSSANANKAVDVKSASKNNGANVQLYSSNNSAAQKWKATKNSDGTYTFMNCNSGKALDVKGGKAASGTNVQQWSKNSSAKAQRWVVTYCPGGFKLTSALAPGIVLDLTNGSTSNGANVRIYNDNGTLAQRFTFEPTTYTAPKPAATTSTSSKKQAMINKASGYSSGTKYLILVNRGAHKVGVFKGSKNNWKLYYYWDCVTGAPSTPTIKGTFRTTGYTRTSLSTDSRARWCTQIWGGYFFHTILASNNELGKSLSHGCIRMSFPSAKWIYNNVHAGTTVVIYN